MEVMAVRTLDASNQGDTNLYSVTRWRAHARRHPLRHRLAVVAPTAADVIRHVGGWLFDRTIAGWEATVLVADCTNARSLGILGAKAVDLEQSLAEPVRDTWPSVVVVDSQMYRSDCRVRTGVLECLDRGLIEVALWGDELPVELDHRVAPVEHRSSSAARAFKACALAAAGFPAEDVAATEAVFNGLAPLGVFAAP
jgi:hypothetical protein